MGEVVSLGGEEAAAGSWMVEEEGCQEAAAGMGTRKMMHWAEEVVVAGQQDM